MPTISIFIRKEDLPKWQSLEHKSEWLHIALGLIDKDGTAQLSFEHRDGFIDEQTKIVTPLQAVSEPFTPKPPDPTTGYPCCLKKSPCKHWHWNDLEEVWENELTGATKAG